MNDINKINNIENLKTEYVKALDEWEIAQLALNKANEKYFDLKTKLEKEIGSEEYFKFICHIK